MSDATLVRIGRRFAIAMILAGIASVVVHLVAGAVALFSRGNFSVQFAVAAVGFGAIAWIVLPSQPRNGMVWALLGSGFFGAVASVGTATVATFAPADVATASELFAYSPSELSTPAAIGAMLAGGTWVAMIFLVVGVGLLLFPDGRPPSPRWRWLVWLNTSTILSITLILTLLSNPNSTAPIETSGEDYGGIAGAIVAQLFFPLLVGSVLAIVSLVVRYRRSSGAARPQIQWIALGGLAFLIGGVAAEPDAVLWPMMIGQVLLIAAFFVAITKYRLYDINVVISRTVAYVSLAAVLVLLYGGAIFVYVGLFADAEQRDSGDLGLALPIGATLLVAIIFEPLRRRLSRWADRLVYGKRAAPHEVLSQITAALADTSSSSGLDTMARLLAQGTAAENASVWLRVGNRLRAEAVQPMDPSTVGSHRPLLDEARSTATELAVPVRRGDELLGQLEITKSEAHGVTPADIELLTDVAASAGLLLHNMRLNAELADRAQQLRDSRRRLIAAHDEVRHRLERDLHDGAQQQVVALKVKLGLARTIAEREGATDIAALLEGLAADTDEAVDGMRQVARGIYPPLLEAEGLATALHAFSRTTAVESDISVDIEGRYPRPVEETVYFSVVHAIGAAVAAGARTVRATLMENPTDIGITIRHEAPYNLDVTPLVDRIDAHDGRIEVEEHSLAVTVPVAEAVPA